MPTSIRAKVTTIGEVMKNFGQKVVKFLKSEDGPTAVEYAVMLALIVIVCLTAIQAVGSNASSAFTEIASEISNARTAGTSVTTN